ncbi:hypothetical protein EGN72_04085 [Pseudorhodobacter sp. E13]|jgi:hypothetical protein|uniref:hypothetical protein n=1 Tax=Pseudorhodobacter sp. E13 TaxID=2487931 RepID=UPI000F8F0773|nr:hypothetical protein [Pseudorhodobacter sp. E13]RUS63425.1 hypothetical protein EGN72_04085 [Pseudorhodobacter sp. E13]
MPTAFSVGPSVLHRVREEYLAQFGVPCEATVRDIAVFWKAALERAAVASPKGLAGPLAAEVYADTVQMVFENRGYRDRTS